MIPHGIPEIKTRGEALQGTPLETHTARDISDEATRSKRLLAWLNRFFMKCDRSTMSIMGSLTPYTDEWGQEHPGLLAEFQVSKATWNRVVQDGVRDGLLIKVMARSNSGTGHAPAIFWKAPWECGDGVVRELQERTWGERAVLCDAANWRPKTNSIIHMHQTLEGPRLLGAPKPQEADLSCACVGSLLRAGGLTCESGPTHNCADPDSVLSQPYIYDPPKVDPPKFDRSKGDQDHEYGTGQVKERSSHAGAREDQTPPPKNFEQEEEVRALAPLLRDVLSERLEEAVPLEEVEDVLMDALSAVGHDPTMVRRFVSDKIRKVCARYSWGSTAKNWRIWLRKGWDPREEVEDLWEAHETPAPTPEPCTPPPAPAARPFAEVLSDFELMWEEERPLLDVVRELRAELLARVDAEAHLLDASVRWTLEHLWWAYVLRTMEPHRERWNGLVECLEQATVEIDEHPARQHILVSDVDGLLSARVDEWQPWASAAVEKIAGTRYAVVPKEVTP